MTLSFERKFSDRSFYNRLTEGLNAQQPQRFIVAFDDRAIEGTDGERATRLAALKNSAFSGIARNDLSVLDSYNQLPLAYVEVNSRDAFNALLARPEVAYVYPNQVNTRLLASSLPVIGQPQAQAAGYTGQGTAVAVIDDGGNPSAPGLSGRVVADIAFVSNPGTDEAHGTNVSGIVAGVAASTGIVALDVFDDSGSAFDSDILEALNWAIANRAQYNIVAINLSLGNGARYRAPIVSSFLFKVPTSQYFKVRPMQGSPLR